jgi:argininosuccinate synthase
MTIDAAHRYVEQLTMDRDSTHLRYRLAPEVAEMVYYGSGTAEVRCLARVHSKTPQRTVTGSVTLELYKGNVNVSRAVQPEQLVRRSDCDDWKVAVPIIKPMPRASSAFRTAFRVQAKSRLRHLLMAGA